MTIQRTQYPVKLEVFEGPLDLLLYLIKREEVDIYDIPIERVTDQYMEYIELIKILDLNIAGEFLVMAATLMMIKSRMLLPVEERTEWEDEEEVDPRWDLVRQLVEYKKFKDAAHHLESLSLNRENVFSREGEGVRLEPEDDLALQDVSVFDLIAAFNEALRNIKQEQLQEIFRERFTVAEKVDAIMGLLETRENVSLTSLLKDMGSRQEIICTFLAVLELMRLRQIEARQKSTFDEIIIMRSSVAV